GRSRADRLPAAVPGESAAPDWGSRRRSRPGGPGPWSGCRSRRRAARRSPRARRRAGRSLPSWTHLLDGDRDARPDQREVLFVDLQRERLANAEPARGARQHQAERRALAGLAPRLEAALVQLGVLA